ncbi:MAG: type I methionyl aminopeptidase [Bacteroidia bacterium]|nr:type I methionyl aminopeptidase [Bacteroidia bacterium]
MIYLKTSSEIEIMRQAAQLVSKTLAMLAEEIKEGLPTITLDRLAEEFIISHGAKPAFKGYGSGKNKFPYTLCISINEEVVHGMPKADRYLKDGDIVSIDCGVILNEFHGDHAYTFGIGNIGKEKEKLLRVTKECLYLGIEQMVAGNRIGDISHAIQQHAQKNGFGVVRELVGHGLGKNLHEEPQVPNYGKRGSGPKLIEGMVLAIEPMINMGTKDVIQKEDGWTIVTADRKPSAHFEHDVALVHGKAEILSDFSIIEDVIKKNPYLVNI